MNLKEWARQQGVHPVSAYRWFRDGRLPVPARRAGRLILVEPGTTPAPGVVAGYPRVPSAGQRPDLDRQVARVTGWAAGEGLPAGRVMAGAGSARNGKRRKFLALVRDGSVTTIVVEHRDRFGAGYAGAALAASGRRLLVVDPAGVDDDLVRDVTEILTALCARLDGRRAAANRARRAVGAVTGDAP